MKTCRSFCRLLVLLVPSLLLCLQASAAEPSFPDRLQLLGQLYNRQFDQLEESIRSAQVAYESGQQGDRRVEFVLETLANSDPQIEDHFSEWITLDRQNYVPYLARAYFYYDVAWSWRGHQHRKDTPAERIAKMKTYLQKAAADISRAVDIHPGLSVADALALKILMMLGQRAYQQQAFAEAIRLHPHSYTVRSSYLWSLKPEWGGEAGELMDIIADTRKVAGITGDTSALLGYADYIFADSLSVDNRLEEAAVHFDFAVSKGADHIIYRERGINRYRLQSYELALEDFNTALSLWPQDAKTLRWRSHALQRLGRLEEAMTDLDLAVVLAPMQKHILLSHAMLARKLKRFEQVAGNYEKALYYNSGDADIWFARGMHYSHELVDFDAARRDLRRATELAPGEPAYWYEYAAVLHFTIDCNIVGPLEHYLRLCEEGGECHSKEHKWALHAREWLDENDRCVAGGKADDQDSS